MRRASPRPVETEQSPPGRAAFLPLPPSFYARPAETVAEALLGKRLVRRAGSEETAHEISETEAYLGPHDLACHAAKGRTRRTEVMFGPAGAIYMYLIYGMYWMLNIVTDEPGYPAAVLIRAAGEHAGPGRLTRALALDGSFNGASLTPETGLWISDGAPQPVPQRIARTPRIGIDYAGPIWAKKKLRFVFT